MATKSFVWHNGAFVSTGLHTFGIENRSFAYGDGLFETIHAFGTSARHLRLHFNRLLWSMKLLGMDPPTHFSETFLDQEISRLLNKNRIFGSARVRVTVNRKTGGYYAPSGFGIDMTIQTSGLEENFYVINQKGLVVDFYTELRKPTNFLSNIKTTSSMLHVLAGLHARSIEVDESLLINDQNRLAESTSSNIFLVKDKMLLTPPLNEGCLKGIVRELIIDIAPKLGYKVIQDRPVEPELLTQSDEVFLTNAISGIRWVVAFKTFRYFSKVSRELCAALNRFTFPDQFKEGFSG
jgi:branched-subunit amino acid aminotransferase/4-amino-4-deoxychorismate lyase